MLANVVTSFHIRCVIYPCNIEEIGIQRLVTEYINKLLHGVKQHLLDVGIKRHRHVVSVKVCRIHGSHDRIQVDASSMVFDDTKPTTLCVLAAVIRWLERGYPDVIGVDKLGKLRDVQLAKIGDVINIFGEQPRKHRRILLHSSEDLSSADTDVLHVEPCVTIHLAVDVVSNALVVEELSCPPLLRLRDGAMASLRWLPQARFAINLPPSGWAVLVCVRPTSVLLFRRILYLCLRCDGGICLYARIITSPDLLNKSTPVSDALIKYLATRVAGYRVNI